MITFYSDDGYLAGKLRSPFAFWVVTWLIGSKDGQVSFPVVW